MSIIIYCDVKDHKPFLDQIGVNICDITKTKWEASIWATLIMFTLILYMLIKWKKRNETALLTFHNVRAALAVILLVINTIELARAILSKPGVKSLNSTTALYQMEVEYEGKRNIEKIYEEMASHVIKKQQELKLKQVQQQQQTEEQLQNTIMSRDQVSVVIGETLLANAFTAIVLTILLMWYHRVIEIKKTLEFLYVSCTMSLLIFTIRLYELTEIMYFDIIWELESCIQLTSALCLLGVGFIDGFTVYKERYRPEHVKDTNKIVYKHSLATFYSKICFWWLTPLFWYGYKQPLELNDLGQMRIEDSARAHYDRFLLIYKTTKASKENQSVSLWLCYIKSSWHLFLLSGVLKLFGDLVAIIGPLAIQQIVQYIEIMYNTHYNNLLRNINNQYNSSRNGNATINDYASSHDNTSINWERIFSMLNNENGSSFNMNDIIDIKILYVTWLDLVTNGWTLAWIVLLAALAQGTLSQASAHILNMTGIRIKTSLQGLIYRKILLSYSTWYCNDYYLNANVTISNVGQQKINKMQQAEQEKPHQNLINNTPLAVNTENFENVMYKLFREYKSTSKRKMNDISKESAIASATTQTPLIEMTEMATPAPTISVNEANKAYNPIVSRNRNNWEQHSHDVNNIGALTNLMSEDTFNVMSCFWIAHYVWTIPLKIAVIMYLLYLQLGISAIIGCAMCIIIMTPLQFLIGRAMSNNTEVMAHHTDKRLKLLYDTLLGMKLIKLNAWDQLFIKKIRKARNEELKYLNKDSILWTLMTILIHISTVLVTFVTLMIYVYWHINNQTGSITASRLFTSLALFQQLTVPLLIFPNTVPIILSAISSTKRLQNYLAANKIQRQNEDKPLLLIKSESQRPLTREQNKCFHHKDEQKRLSSHVPKELLRNTPYVVIRPKILPTYSQPFARNSSPGRRSDSWHRDSLLLNMPDDIAVSIKEGIYSWNPNKKDSFLYINDLNIPKGKLSIIMGENGSGKSSLLYALLMEMPLISGHMIWNKTSTLAFVPQQPWLLNTTVRENILFGESYQPERYSQVLNACALKLDIKHMPMGDLTVVGESGVNLSGGQKQRISIARALYSSTNVVIMDDPLPSLDNKIAKHVVERSIGKMLLKANRTVILVTQQLHLIHKANYLIVLKDGCLEASGSYIDIKLTHPHIFKKWCNIMSTKPETDEQKPNRHYVIDELQQDILKRHTEREKGKLSKSIFKPSIKHLSLNNGNDFVENCPCSDNKSAVTFIDPDHKDNNRMLQSPISLATNKSFKLKRRPSSIYNLRHLLYDIPLPIDECQMGNDVLRRRRRSVGTSHANNLSPTTTRLDQNLLRNTCPSTSKSTYNNDDNAIVSAYNRLDNNKWYSEATGANHSTSIKFNGKNRNIVENNDGIHQFVKCASSTKYKGHLKNRKTKHNVKYTDKSSVCRNVTEDNSNDDDHIITLKENPDVREGRHTKTATEIFSWHDKNILENENHVKCCKTFENVLNVINEDMSAVSPAMATKITEIVPTNVIATNIMTAENVNTTDGSSATQKPIITVTINNKEPQNGFSTKRGNRVSKRIVQKSTATMTTLDVNIPAVKKESDDDVERKYGAIPAEVYLLYMQASGYTIVFMYFISALIWQSLRIYADVWLQQWTDDNNPVINATLISTWLRNLTIQQQTIGNVNIVDGNGDVDDRNEHNVYMDDDIHNNAINLRIDEPHDVIYYFHVYAKISFGCVLMALISTPIGQWSGCRARRHLHDKLLHAIIHRSLYFFEITSIGRLMNRFSNDIAIIDKKIAATSQRLLQFALLCLCAVIINFAITPWFIIITIPLCVAYYVIQKFYRCSSRELQRIESATNTPILSHLAETIEGITTIRAYHQQARFTEIFFKRLEANTVAFTILNSSNRWLGISLDYLGGALVFLAILTALLVATIACNQHVKKVIISNENGNVNENLFFSTNLKQQQEELQPQRILLNLKYHTLAPAPSLVGLAINYTLLMPTYLNWVVKLLADMDMYVSSVERISHYTNDNGSEISESMTVMATKTSNANVKEMNEKNYRIGGEEEKVGQSYCEMNRKTMLVKNKLKWFKATVGKRRIVKAQKNDKLLSTNVHDNPTEFIPTFNERSATSIATFNVKHDGNDDNNLIVKVFNKNNKQKGEMNKEQYEDIGTLNGNGEMEMGKCSTVDITIVTTATLPKSVTTATVTGTATATASIKPLMTAATIDECCNVENKVIVRAIKNNRSNHNQKQKKTYFFKATRRAQTSQFNDAQHVVVGSQYPFNLPFTYSCYCRYYYSSTLPNKQYQSVPLSWPQRGDIIFENVCLGYMGQSSPVIKNLSLIIPAGQKIGICGRTGSGKSSLALSLFGVLQVFSGRICIDGIDLSLIHPNETCNRLSIIPQDVHVFSTTIRENLDPYGYHTDFELWQCLELAQLKEFITNKLSMGLDTKIGEGGLTLSLGHRQLLCLARAILRGSICLVLDEATTAVDNTTEKTLLQVAFQAFQGRTIIIIAHRLINMLDCDRIIVLENGKIIEDDVPQRLQQRTESYFHSLLNCEYLLSSYT